MYTDEAKDRGKLTNNIFKANWSKLRKGVQTYEQTYSKVNKNILVNLKEREMQCDKSILN